MPSLFLSHKNFSVPVGLLTHCMLNMGNSDSAINLLAPSRSQHMPYGWHLSKSCAVFPLRRNLIAVCFLYKAKEMHFLLLDHHHHCLYLCANAVVKKLQEEEIVYSMINESCKALQSNQNMFFIYSLVIIDQFILIRVKVVPKPILGTLGEWVSSLQDQLGKSAEANDIQFAHAVLTPSLCPVEYTHNLSLPFSDHSVFPKLFQPVHRHMQRQVQEETIIRGCFMILIHNHSPL